MHISNVLIDKSIWPDAMKHADIKSVYKSNNEHIPSNCRPTSLISNVAKIFENIYHRILHFVQQHCIISNNEYGFMKNIGTKDALNDVSMEN